MSQDTTFKHVAIHCNDRKAAEQFFTEILKIPKVKSFTLSQSLSQAIFQINTEVSVDAYDNGSAYFEVFITSNIPESVFQHVCIQVDNKKDFITRCKKYGIYPFAVNKEGKDLLFVRDFSDNLYEVKEK